MITVIPADGVVFIHATAAACKVSRFEEMTPDGPYFDIRTAANWEELEPEARAEAERQIGALTASVEWLACPADLAARATW